MHIILKDKCYEIKELLIINNPDSESNVGNHSYK